MSSYPQSQNWHRAPAIIIQSTDNSLLTSFIVTPAPSNLFSFLKSERSSKGQIRCVIPLFKALQWLRINTKLLNTAYNVFHGLPLSSLSAFSETIFFYSLFHLTTLLSARHPQPSAFAYTVFHSVKTTLSSLPQMSPFWLELGKSPIAHLTAPCTFTFWHLLHL